MKRALFVLFLVVAVHHVPLATASPTAPRQESLTALATRIATAAIAGDRETVMKHMITFEQLTALSRRAAAHSESRWQRDVEGFFRSARDDRRRGIVVAAEIIGSGTLSPGKDDVTRETEFAFVQLTIESDCDGCSAPRTRSIPRVFGRMLFLKLPGGWRFAFK
jgi:hypothetical protein